MNKKQYFDVLEHADDDTVEKIEKKYPVLDEEKTEKIFEMSMKKMHEMKQPDGGSDGWKAEGVAHYKRPLWHKLTGLAAAAAIVAGGIALYQNRPDFDSEMHSDVSSNTDEVPTTISVTEAAAEILANYEDFVNVFLIHDNVAISEAVSFNTDVPVVFYKYKDERFQNSQALKDHAETIFEPQYFEENYSIIGGDFTSESMIPDYYPSYDLQQTFSFGGKIPVFINYNGSLYAYYFSLENRDLNSNESLLHLTLTDYTTDFKWKEEEAEIKIINEDSFLLTKECVIVRNKLTITEKTELTVNKTEDGRWLISNVAAEVLETEAPQEETAADNEYAQIAEALIDQYRELQDIYTYGTDYDADDVIQFNVVPSQAEMEYITNEEQYQQQLEYYTMHETGKYCRSTDERFSSIEDVEGFTRSVVSERLFDELFADDLKDRMQGCSAGDEVESDQLSLFIMRDGNLYVHAYARTGGDLFNHWTDTPIRISDVTENSFTAERTWSDHHPDYEASLTDLERMLKEDYVSKYSFTKDPATGEWRLDQELQF